MDLGLADRVAIVTGASRGLGKVAAEALAAEGACVLAVARSRDALKELAASSQGRIATAECDVRNVDALQALPDRALAEFGRLDILINNAGIAPATDFLEQDWSVWQDVMAVNVTAPALLAQAAGRHFATVKAGKIVNIASTAGLRGKPGLVAYSTSKGAVINFTRALAAEWAGIGVQANAIAPGAFPTDAQRQVLESEDLLARRVRRIPAGRMGDLDEFAPLVCLLASPIADFITGSIFVIDGGEVAKL